MSRDLKSLASVTLWHKKKKIVDDFLAFFLFVGISKVIFVQV